jgi:transcriptional regulator EpsA
MAEPRVGDPPCAAAPAPPSVTCGAGQVVLDALQVESLTLNLAASLRVHARSHFFGWAQGLMQSLIPHEVLICALRGRAPSSLRVDSFSTVLPDANVCGDLLLRDPSFVAELTTTWKQRRFRPLTCDIAAGGPCGGALGRELVRIGATRVFAHGGHDAEGEVCSFFVFAARPEAVGPAAAYLVELVVPFLHAAWIRSQILETREGACLAPAGVAALTAREQEILRWICLGKSNGEVGAILEISPLTVKNHVQKILRKLNVVNRAQAVAKALEARLLGP